MFATAFFEIILICTPALYLPTNDAPPNTPSFSSTSKPLESDPADPELKSSKKNEPGRITNTDFERYGNKKLVETIRKLKEENHSLRQELGRTVESLHSVSDSLDKLARRYIILEEDNRFLASRMEVWKFQLKTNESDLDELLDRLRKRRKGQLNDKGQFKSGPKAFGLLPSPFLWR